jgi:hypothetical protein
LRGKEGDSEGKREREKDFTKRTLLHRKRKRDAFEELV